MEGRAEQVDLNAAGVEALIELSGIGPVLAQRIVAERPFEQVDDLVRVRGIGPETLERLRPFVVVSAGDTGPPRTPEEGEPASLPSPHSGGIPALPAEDAGAEEVGVTFEAKAPETVPLRAPEPGLVQEVDDMEKRELVGKSDQAGAVQADVPEAGASEAETAEAEALKTEGAGEDVAPWEKEPIPGLDEEISFVGEDIPFEDQDIPMPDEAIPGVEVARVAEAAPERKRPPVTRARVRWMALLSIVLATLLATLLSLSILSYINGGQLQYVTPARFGELSARAEGLEAQAGVLVQDVEGLRKRLDNLEALSGRLGAVEQASERVQADLEVASGEIDKLAAQAGELATQAAAMARQAEEVEGRVSTLEAQGSRAQAFLEGLAELMHTLFPPEASTK